MRDETYIAVLLDRSGSMQSIRQDVIGGFNTFIEDQKKAGDNAFLTLVQFDSVGIDTVLESKPIKDVPALSEATYEPRGGTPLLDALGQTINRTGSALAAIPESVRPDKVVFVIITDGQENASQTFTKEQIQEMIELQEGTYKWNFVYLGANVNSFDEARMMGMKVDLAANYAPNSAGMKAAYAVASHNIRAYRGTNNRDDLNISKQQREKMMSDEE
jgi:Mg-chelatase subunit ChlD